MKKSELDYAAAAPLTPAGAPTGWRDALLANGPLPLLLLLLIPLGMLVQDRERVDPYYARMIMLVGFNVILAVGLQLINGFSGQFSLGHAGFMAVGAYLAAYPAKFHGQLAGSSAQRIDDPGSVLAYYAALGAVVLVTLAAFGGILYGIRVSKRLHPAAPAIVMVAVLGWIVWDVAKAEKYASPPPWLIWSSGASSLGKLFATLLATGLPIGAKFSALLPAFAREPLCFICLILGGGTFAAVTGFVVGLPTLRLRGDYLAIATLGLSEIIRIVFQNSEPMGRALGLTGIPRYTNFAWLYGVGLLSVVVVWRLAYSARGRAIQAVREDEIAAAAVGIDPTRTKVLAFVGGAFVGGVAGALFSLYERSITPSSFGLQKSIEIVVIVTLGGLGSISGAILAAIVLTLLPEVLRPVAEYRMVIYSLLLIFMMLVRPQGLLAGREIWFRRKRKHPPPATDEQMATIVAPTEPGAALEARRVCRKFGGLSALNNFSLRIAPGELVGLIGPNGAGKTTAFNVITGVYAPTDGAITLGDVSIGGMTSVEINRCGIARTFQNIRLFKSLTALDNVAAGFARSPEHGLVGTILRTPRFYRERYASEAEAMRLLTTLNLASAADVPAGSLPYGDQRRLEIARALATGPHILLLDEPAAGMNPQEKLALMDLIRLIRDRFAVGVWLIEHDMKLVMTICQRITVLDHGEVIAVGSPAEVQSNPAVIEAYLGEPA